MDIDFPASTDRDFFKNGLYISLKIDILCLALLALNHLNFYYLSNNCVFNILSR